MSIPIERRDIGDGWVITCRGRNGKDLTLSNVSVEKDNLICRVLGSTNVFSPMNEGDTDSLDIDGNHEADVGENSEVSILDHIAQMIRNAQKHGCWIEGVGGVIKNSPKDFFANSALDGLPMSEVLCCAVDLWENLQIDDDELLEIAIKDVSYQIGLQKQTHDDDIGKTNSSWSDEASRIRSKHKEHRQSLHDESSVPFDLDITNTNTLSTASNFGRRFDPQNDPTILFLSINKLTSCLDDFTFRVEPAKQLTIFDPVFEGVGSLAIKNASIKLRIECRKERIHKLGEDVTVPVMQVQELQVELEQVNFRFKETGADWLLNKIVGNFTDNITKVVKDNLRDQITKSINVALDHLNRYIEVNPDVMLKILGITLDDLEENVAWV